MFGALVILTSPPNSCWVKTWTLQDAILGLMVKIAVSMYIFTESVFAGPVRLKLYQWMNLAD